MSWQNFRPNLQYLIIINGIIPFVLVLIFISASESGFFNLGYIFYGWVEIIILSTFVSMVPGVAYWLLFGQIILVGAEATANLFITVLILLGAILVLVGYLRSFSKNKNKEINGRTLWLIGGILTFPLGFLSLYVYIKTKPKRRQLSLKQRISSELRKNKLPYILIVPSLIFLAFTYVVPIIKAFYMTFFEFTRDRDLFFGVNYFEDPLLWTINSLLAFGEPTFIGFNNYLELFSNTTRAIAFQSALHNNVYFVILFVPGVILVSLSLAVLLNNKLLKSENAYTTIFYMPVITSVIVVSVIWLRIVFPLDGLMTMIILFLKPLIDGFFAFLNIFTLGVVPANVVEGGINWLSDKNDRMIESVALMSIWRSVGFDVLILLAGLKSIPSSLYEAADIDGHGGWSKFKNITLPNLKGPLGVVIILELINGWQIFQEFYGLNLATFGGNQSLAIYLISNMTDPPVITFASTVGYFIFGMTAFIGLLGRVEIKGILKFFALFSLLAILFSIPSNRPNTSPKSFGFTVSWITFDVVFLALAFLCLFYYVYTSILKGKQLENDRRDLKITGFFVLAVSPFYLLNGYKIITGGGAGSTPIVIFDIPIPSLIFGLIMLFIALLMISANYFVPYLKKQRFASFLFTIDDIKGG